MMDQHYILLLHKRLRGELTEVEHVRLQSWLEQHPDHRSLARQVERIWQLSEEYTPAYTPDVEAGLARLKQRMKQAPSPQPARRYTIGRRWTVAASFLLLIAALGFWLFGPFNTNYYLVATGAGEQKTVTLYDGTKIILNENSELKYPDVFTDERLVHLSGEAYFEVVRNEELPFCVTTPKTRTDVLGTVFNVRAYPQEAFTEVEVIDGKVSLRPLDAKENLMLRKGARGQYHHNKARLKQDVPKTLNATYWKDKQLRFKAHKLPEVLQEIQNRLDIDIQFDNPALASCTWTRTISLTRTQPETIVASIADSFGASWEKTTAGSYLLKGGHCDRKN